MTASYTDRELINNSESSVIDAWQYFWAAFLALSNGRLVLTPYKVFPSCIFCFFLYKQISLKRAFLQIELPLLHDRLACIVLERLRPFPMCKWFWRCHLWPYYEAKRESYFRTSWTCATFSTFDLELKTFLHLALKWLPETELFLPNFKIAALDLLRLLAISKPSTSSLKREKIARAIQFFWYNLSSSYTGYWYHFKNVYIWAKTLENLNTSTAFSRTNPGTNKGTTMPRGPPLLTL